MTLKDVPLVWPQFAHPVVLVALAVPLLLLAWVWGGRRLLPTRRVVLPFDHARPRGGRWATAAVGIAESLPPLLLAVAVAVLAGPQRNAPPQQKRALTNIQFAVDVSGSMLAQFGEGNRYDASMKAIDHFLDFRKGDAFGLTFFGDAYVHWVPLTTDTSAVRCSVPFMKPDLVPPPFGGTAIAKALRGCKSELRRRDDGEKMIVLVTDGFSYDLQDQDQELARELSAEGVSVFCIIVGGFDPQAEIVTICRRTGGEAFRADDPDALPTVFKKIDTLKQAKLTPTAVETVDYYEPFAAAGGVLLAASALTLLGLRYTPW